MRRWAISFAFLWLSFALSIRLYDMRKPHTYISTLTGGQRHDKATLAWLQGPMPLQGTAGRGRMVVVDTRIDGKIEVAMLQTQFNKSSLDCGYRFS